MNVLIAAERWADGELAKDALRCLRPDAAEYSRTKATPHDLSHSALHYLTEWDQSTRFSYNAATDRLERYRFAEGEQLEGELNIVLNNATGAIVRHRLGLERGPIQDGKSLRQIQQEEERRLCITIRDIFGNPFRPIAFDSAWRTSSAVGLAQGVYESRNFAAMPVLADALQDAGCEHADVLGHCRDPQQVHVRGCWVVDLVLGKE